MTDALPQLALAASPRDWVLRVHQHVADHGGAVVRTTALRAADVLAEDVHVLIVDESTSFLTRSLVEELHARGARVIGVHDDEDPRAKGELVALGVDEVVSHLVSAEALVTLAGTLATAAGAAAMIAVERHDRITDPPPAPSAPLGRLVAVAGVSGGCGATEVALALAVTAGRARGRPVLVDADTAAPSLGQRLDLPLYPNLRTAVDGARHSDDRALGALRRADDGRLPVLVGIASSDDWDEITPSEVLGALEVLRRRAGVVVVDVGAGREDLPSPVGRGRHGVPRAVLEEADVLIGVTLPTPTGVTRALSWAAALRGPARPAPHLVINRSPRGAFRREEVAAELRRTLRSDGLTFAPHDGRVEAASWAGTPVAEGPFTQALRGLAARVTSIEGTAPRWRDWRRRASA